VQYLQNKENANKVFDEVKALKTIDFIKSVVTLDNKEIPYNEFKELVK
jgi:trigger factor